MNLKFYKFLVRVFLTVALMSFGMAIFWTTNDPNVRAIGVGLVSGIVGTWMSAGSTAGNSTVKVNAKEHQAFLDHVKPINHSPLTEVVVAHDLKKLDVPINHATLTEVVVDDKEK